jgi:hypothetical protein
MKAVRNDPDSNQRSLEKQMTTRATAFGLICAAGWAVSAATAQVTLEKVIVNTDPVPTVAGAQWLSSQAFSWGESIDQNGNVAFVGSMQSGVGGVTSNDHYIAHYGQPGSLQFLARTIFPGDDAPGLPGVQLYTIQSTNIIPLSANGNIWFGGQTPNPNGYIATGLFGSMQKVVRRNDVLPGGATATAIPSSTTPYPLVNSNGQTAFVGPTATSGVYVGGPGTLQLAWKTGVAYSSLPGSSSLSAVGNVCLVNGQGNVSSTALLTSGGSITTANDEVLFTRAWNAAQGSFNVIAREGDAAPGCGGATYLHNTNTTFTQVPGNYNNQDHAIFSCGLEGTGVTASNNAAVWYNNGAASLFRRSGDVSTAVPGGATYTIGGLEAGHMRLNNNDQVAWIATFTQGVGGVDATNDSAIVRTTLGSSTDSLLARKGDNVKDPATNTLIVPGALYAGFDTLEQNNRGQIVFRANFVQDPNDPNHTITAGLNDQALFAWDPVGGLMLVCRRGDDLSSLGITFTVNTITTPSSASNAANAEGGSSVFTDNGWLTFAISTPLTGTLDNSAIMRTRISSPCYANCDGSTTAPVLNVGDFTCFLQKFAAGNSYANCDASTTPPVLNVGDFTCFLQKYAAGCQ